jgi:hypothetical protein
VNSGQAGLCYIGAYSTKYSWDSDGEETVMEKNNQNNKLSTNEQQLLLETKNGKIRSNQIPSTPGAEESYCCGEK